MATRKPPPPREPRLDLAGDLCVAFVNTAAATPENRQLGIADYGELVAWAFEADLVSAAEGRSLRRQASEHPAQAKRAYARTAKLRSSLTRLFLAVGAKQELPEDDLDLVGKELARVAPGRRLVVAKGGVAWGWSGDEKPFDRILGPVLHSAAELLISLAGRPHVRRCARQGCALFFVDRSPSARRRYCEAKTCGHRARALRHYHRKGKHRRTRDWLYR